ncbi:MAG: diguanylate cyclase domain-containing protein, partial [Saezia sp.]
MLFGKQKKEQVEKYLNGIFESFDTDIIVVREKECVVLYMNAVAKERMKEIGTISPEIDRNYIQDFSDELCDWVSKVSQETELPIQFDVKNDAGRQFSVNANTILWVDGKPAVLLILRDVEEERNLQKKLFSLAYRDQLTGVANRQKFKEDFEDVAQQIEEEKLHGTVSIFDLDNFKSINDTYGHNTGDIMLKRLTDHMESDKAFKGHIYRLGGDEFVLFYQEPNSRFSSYEELRDYYQKLLENALLSYTMPNIELSCTLSMGIAFYPKHGTSSSELLRKADIALYKAKAEGRNRLVIFEDKYDTAKKFKDLYIGIQPIMTQAGKTFGYELVDRGEDETEKEEVSLTESDRAIDALGLSDISNDIQYFIRFSDQLLNQPVMRNLPKNKFIIQAKLPETIEAKDVQWYKELKSHGYTLSFSELTRANATNEVMYLGKFFKFSLSADENWQKNIIAANTTKQFIATGVDSAYDLEKARIQGFRFFQGYFFNEPVVVQKTKDISPLKVNYFRLL